MAQIKSPQSSRAKRHRKENWAYVKRNLCFSCDRCGETFDEELHRDSHLLVHNPEPLVDCRWCSKKYKVQSLKNHERKVHSHELALETANCITHSQAPPFSPISEYDIIAVANSPAQSTATLSSSHSALERRYRDGSLPSEENKVLINAIIEFLNDAALVPAATEPSAPSMRKFFKSHASSKGREKRSRYRNRKNSADEREEIPESDDSDHDSRGQYPLRDKISKMSSGSSVLESLTAAVTGTSSQTNAFATQQVDQTLLHQRIFDLERQRDQRTQALLNAQNYLHNLHTTHEAKERKLLIQIDSLKSASRQLQLSDAAILLAEKEQQISSLQEEVQTLLDNEAVLRATSAGPANRESADRRMAISHHLKQLAIDIETAALNNAAIPLGQNVVDYTSSEENMSRELLSLFEGVQFDFEGRFPRVSLHVLLSMGIAIWVFASDFPNFDKGNNRMLELLRKRIASQMNGLQLLHSWDILGHAKLVRESSFTKYTVPTKAAELSDLFEALVGINRHRGHDGTDQSRVLSPQRLQRSEEVETDESTASEQGDGEQFDRGDNSSSHVEQAFTGALRLKAEMILTGRRYELVFFKSGTVFDNRFMELQNEFTDADRRAAADKENGNILICCFPLVLELEVSEVVRASTSHGGNADEDEDWQDALVQKHIMYRVSGESADFRGLVLMKAVVLSRL